MCSDQGADAWHYKMKFFYRFNIRGTEMFDDPHRTIRNIALATSETGGSFIQSEFGTVFAFVRGPWKSESNLQLIRYAAKEMFASFDHNSRMFRLLYDRICHSRYRGLKPPGYGSDEHHKILWLECQSDPLASGVMGEEFQSNRWTSWSARFQWHSPSFDVLLMILVYMLITRGLKDLNDCPCLKALLTHVAADPAMHAVHPPEDQSEYKASPVSFANNGNA